MSTMRFTLLGPVSVWADGAPLDVPDGRPALVLATLLAARGETATPDRLIDALWDEPPVSASANLRTYLARVRRALGEHAERLTRTNVGHALRILPGELDLDRFVSAVEAVKDGQLKTSPDDAADRLRDALDIWSGSVAGEGLQRFGAMGRFLDALDEQRLLTVERYAAACLAAGRHQAATEAIGPVVRRHETRETAWWLLIRGLHESGDRNEALRVWKLASQTLRAELGVDPSARMRQLLDRIKAGPAERAGARDIPAPVATVRRDLLPPARQLFGRSELLGQIIDAATKPGVVLLHGVAGVGKSALAVGAAHNLADSFPDGRTYLDLCGSTPGLAPMSPEEVATSLLRMFGVEEREGSLGYSLAALTKHLADRRVLVVLDNARDAGQIRAVLRALARATVILTSRAPLPSIEATSLPVGVLDEQSAIQMVGQLGGQERVTEAPDAARTLVRLCGRLPLALRITGARLAAHGVLPIQAMVERLSDEQHVLDELTVDDLEVRSSLALMVEHLGAQPHGADAVRLFSYWGVARVPELGHILAQALLGGDAQRARLALDRLASSGLIETHGQHRYRLHDLVRLYAAELGSRDPVEREGVVHGTRSYLLGGARRARDVIRADPYRVTDVFTRDDLSPAVLEGTDDAMAWFEAERPNLVAAARFAHEEGTPEGHLFASRLSSGVYPFLPMRGYYRDLKEIATLGLASAAVTGHRADEAHNRVYLAAALSRMGAGDEAVHELRQALQIRRDLGLGEQVAVTLDHLGYALAAAHRLHEARDAFLEALALHRQGAPDESLGVSLNNLADLLLQLGEVDEALPYLTESLDLRTRIGDHVGVAITTLTIAQAHAGAQRYDDAFDWLATALALARQTGNRESEWRALKVRGELFTALGRTDDALTDLYAALDLSTLVEDDVGTAEVRQLISNVATDAGDGAREQAR